MVDGQAPMKSALDLGDETAVGPASHMAATVLLSFSRVSLRNPRLGSGLQIRTLVELDEETLTKPCCSKQAVSAPASRSHR